MIPKQHTEKHKSCKIRNYQIINQQKVTAMTQNTWTKYIRKYQAKQNKAE
jgi:hypothetical protein